MATAASVATDWTTCPICLEVFDNPKSLPCIHGFCLKCLEQHFRDKKPGDEVPCPLCRKKFQIPPDGLCGLQHHFIIQQLVDARGSHCDKHKEKQVELYCHDCNENICVLCFAAKHRQHQTVEVPEMAETLKPGMENDDKLILSSMNAVRQRSDKTIEEHVKSLSHVESVEKMVVEAGEAVKCLVDRQVNECLQKLQSVKTESAKQVEIAQEQFQLVLMKMESFHTYSRELLDKGKPSDVTRAAVELHKRATELLNNDATSVQYRPPHVTFTPADVTQVTSSQLIGKLSVVDGRDVTGKL